MIWGLCWYACDARAALWCLSPDPKRKFLGSALKNYEINQFEYKENSVDELESVSRLR
jgi:hypothetical protein